MISHANDIRSQFMRRTVAPLDRPLVASPPAFFAAGRGSSQVPSRAAATLPNFLHAQRRCTVIAHECTPLRAASTSTRRTSKR